MNNFCLPIYRYSLPITLYISNSKSFSFKTNQQLHLKFVELLGLTLFVECIGVVCPIMHCLVTGTTTYHHHIAISSGCNLKDDY